MDLVGDLGVALQETMIEFRAGKMILEGKRVVPDTRKGQVRIGRGEEGLVHFQWVDRNQNIVEDTEASVIGNSASHREAADDQIIFPNEAMFEKVTQASGRVYILKFNTDDRKFFFWMQEPKDDGDHQLCSSVNYFLSQPLDFSEDQEDHMAPMQLSDDINEGNQPSRVENVGNPGPSSQASTLGASSSGAVRLEDLQRILSNIEPSGAVEDPDGGLGLGDILRPDLIMPLIDSLPLNERLASYLPEGECSSQEFIEVLQSPPFRQQVDSFTYVLKTGQIDLTQFGIDPSKYNFTVLSFLEALEDSVSKAAEGEEGSRMGNTDPMDEGS